MFSRRTGGFTLVEMIVAIVVIGVGLAGVIVAFTTTVRSSADPLIRKQMLSIAEEMLEEALLKPFAVSGTAPGNVLVACGTAAAARSAFDDVSDYNGYATNGICDIDGAAVTGLSAYNLRVAVNAAASLGDVAGGNVKQVTVTVTHGAESLTLDGWRAGYAL